MTTTRKRRTTIQPGDRIRVIENGLKWSGLLIPMGTVGTVYLTEPRHGSSRRHRAVHFDGFHHLQPNGLYFGIGGDDTMSYLPNWAEKAS